MEYVSPFMMFFHNFIYSMGGVADFLVTPIVFGLSPLSLLLPTGLITFIGIAILKWQVSL